MKDRYKYEIEGGHKVILDVKLETTPKEFIEFLRAIKAVMETEINRLTEELNARENDT